MADPIYFRHASSLDHDTGAHPERFGRIEAIERALEERGWLGFEVRDAPAVDLAVLEAVHPREYIEHVRVVSEERGGGSLDPDTVTSPGSFRAALHAAGGAVAAVDALLGDGAPLAFSGLRPPGHHAEAAAAMGFCLFNNVAVAARHALDAHGAERVLVLDWDVHHGNGTAHSFEATAEVLYASIHQMPLYPGTGRLEDAGRGDGAGYTLNCPVPPGSGESTWLPLLEHVVAPVLREYGPDLVLVSAGYDAHRSDPLADCTLETDSFAQMALWVRLAAAECGAPIGVVLEGGYDLEALSASVAATLEALRDGGEPRSLPPDAVTDRCAAQARRWWRL
ncbi:MAG: histone deacetylase [Thermoleophilaceae bacterium]|nr:histone deacetylase [Thermoleophilaceae bacterium]